MVVSFYISILEFDSKNPLHSGKPAMTGDTAVIRNCPCIPTGERTEPEKIYRHRQLQEDVLEDSGLF